MALQQLTESEELSSHTQVRLSALSLSFVLLSQLISCLAAVSHHLVQCRTTLLTQQQFRSLCGQRRSLADELLHLLAADTSVGVRWSQCRS